MPAHIKRSLLFDLLENMDISKFGAKGDDLKALQTLWEKKNRLKGKRGMYPLNLVFNNLLTINTFIENN